MSVPVTLAAEPEAVLVGRARAGDRAAFGELYARYRDHVHWVLRGLLRDYPSDVDDIAADVFTTALDHIGEYEDRGVHFGAWLRTLARYAAAARDAAPADASAAAARDAVRAAAWDAARDAARDAAATNSGAVAAWVAAWDAGWDAALAAGYAAETALGLAVDDLQPSALELVERMIECGRAA